MNLEALLLKVPEVERPTLARTLVREWLLEALQAFAVAAKAGSEVAMWMPSEDPRSASLKLAGVDRKLSALAAVADSHCKFNAFHVPHVENLKLTSSTICTRTLGSS
ncbi:MAG: hypothetical protein ACT6SF_06345 [Hydrogenophaga sp.]|uniref:hypothetical protein n=1 Tax=Hydrogenophaga sp. TaxID=1904254 RepID=UPI004037130C